MTKSINIKCIECGGEGRVIYQIDLGELIEDIDEMGIHNKIAIIKFIRGKHSIGLKEAKHLAEAGISFLQNVERIFPKKSYE